MDQRSASAGDHHNPPPALSPTRQLAEKTTRDRNAAWRRRQRAPHVTRKKISSDDGGELIADEKMEVEKKIAALQKIVPGGETLAVEKLFEETAEYIMALECQVEALRFLAAFVVQGSSENQKRKKLGG